MIPFQVVGDSVVRVQDGKLFTIPLDTDVDDAFTMIRHSRNPTNYRDVFNRIAELTSLFQDCVFLRIRLHEVIALVPSDRVLYIKNPTEDFIDFLDVFIRNTPPGPLQDALMKFGYEFFIVRTDCTKLSDVIRT